MINYVEVDDLNAVFENAVTNWSAPFTVCLKKFFHYVVDSKVSSDDLCEPLKPRPNTYFQAEVSDFARLRCAVELPPVCRVHEGREHYHLVRESVFGENSVSMNFRIDVYSRYA